MDNILTIEHYLEQVRNRIPKNSLDEQIAEKLRCLKQEAVAKNDEVNAKKFWCYQTIHEIQNRYIASFQMMKTQYFYSAWCSLELVEKSLRGLERHFDLNAKNANKFLLSFIKKQTGQFQELYPYQIFISPGFVVLEKKCSICDNLISIRHPCEHLVGEIYHGKICAQEITKAELLEISYTPNPVQKCSVTFIINKKTNKTEDHYNYGHVDYVIRRLNNPFADWNMNWTIRKVPISEFKSVGRNETCPCGSGKKFKLCCSKKDRIEKKHLNVRFSEPPPPGMPAYETNSLVRGKGEPNRPIQLENWIDRFNKIATLENE